MFDESNVGTEFFFKSFFEAKGCGVKSIVLNKLADADGICGIGRICVFAGFICRFAGTGGKRNEHCESHENADEFFHSY